MGGKHKLANRTKNNARPSSSGRSAELLRTAIPSFAGFSMMKETGFSFSLSTTDELDSITDPNIQVTFKKISKKDSITKIKGLQEFVEIIKKSELDTVKAILPIWPRFYNILAMDVDNRVRETTHLVHNQLVLKAKRNIAPYLKQLIAPWFISQYDNYPPAASAATQAFKDAFSTAKFREAVVLYQLDILSYISDNLLVQTAETLSNTKHFSVEDAEAKYERLLISCLQGYCLYFELVPLANIENVAELNKNIISNAKFWKLAKHNITAVRAAWFRVVTVIYQKAIFLLEDKSVQIAGLAFANLDETDPIVLTHIWELILLTVSNVKEWWVYIDPNRLLFPKLWKILSQGGSTNSTIIYPSLLPLISHLPPSIDESASRFYNTFFENFKLGLKKKFTASARSEYVIIVKAFVECFQYVILKKEKDVNLCKELIKDDLLSITEWCLKEDQAAHKIVFNHIAYLLRLWSRSSESQNFNVFVEFFFENVTSMFKQVLFTRHDSHILDIANKQMEFMHSLRYSEKPKKQLKVQFSVDAVKPTERKEQHIPSIIESEKLYLDRLNSFVYAVCQDYIKYTEEKHSPALLQNLCYLVVDFGSECFFLCLNETFKKQNPESRLIDIFKGLFYKWMNSKPLCNKYVFNLIFLLFRYLDIEEKKVILANLLEIIDESCLSWCVQEALSHPYNKDPLIKNWLQSDKVSKFLVTIAEREIHNECPSELNVLLKLTLVEDENGELFMHGDALTQIIDKLVDSLETRTDRLESIDTCSSLAAYISAVVYTESLLLTHTDNLLLALFKLSCSVVENDFMSEETIYEVNTAWQDALTLLTKYVSKEESKRLISKLADIVESIFLESNLEDTHLLNVIVNALRAIYRSLPLSLTDYIKLLLNRSFLSKWKSDLCNLCVLSEYIQGNLSCPYKEIDTSAEDLQEEDILKVTTWMYLQHYVISSNINEDDEEDEGDANNETIPTILTIMDNNYEFIGQILHDLSVIQSYLKTFKNTKYYEEISHYFKLTESGIKTTILGCDEDLKAKLKIVFKKNSLEKAWFWCTSAYSLYSDILPGSLTEVYEEFVKEAKGSSEIGVIHLTQVFCKHLSYDSILGNYDVVTDIIVLNSLMHCSEIEVQIAQVFGKIEKLRSENVPQFLFDSMKMSWQKSQEIIEIIRMCSSLVEKKFDVVNQKYWDLAVMSLVWASNCLKNKHCYEKYQFQALLVAVIKLFLSTDNQMRKLEDQHFKNNYMIEWQDVLVESTHADLVQLWLYLAEQLETKGSIIYIPLIQEIFKVIPNINHEFIFKTTDNTLPKWRYFLKISCSLLVNRRPNLQLWGYKMLIVLIPGLIKIDTEAVNLNSPHRKSLIFEQFKETLVETQEIVNSMLVEFKLGEDSCRIEPQTDSFIYTFAYLLLWDVLLTVCSQACTELRYQYADWLRNEDFLKMFLHNIFRLMPTEILHFNEGISDSLREMFWNKPDVDITGICDSETTEHLVCWLFSSSLTQLPALVRQWWTNLESRVAQTVEKVTIVYVSPNLIVQELNDIVTHQNQFKNMVIKAMSTSREIQAVYTVDEAQVELIITLPNNYPLGGLEVQCNRQIGGSSHKQWLLQFKKCVLHQNGRIWDGLSLWNNNLDKKFDGVEECYICFAVLHPGTYQLPKLSCHTCKKKFHSACLYKWFRTSYKSSCPICRNLF